MAKSNRATITRYGHEPTHVIYIRTGAPSTYYVSVRNEKIGVVRRPTGHYWLANALPGAVPPDSKPYTCRGKDRDTATRVLLSEIDRVHRRLASSS